MTVYIFIAKEPKYIIDLKINEICEINHPLWKRSFLLVIVFERTEFFQAYLLLRKRPFFPVLMTGFEIGDDLHIGRFCCIQLHVENTAGRRYQAIKSTLTSRNGLVRDVNSREGKRNGLAVFELLFGLECPSTSFSAKRNPANSTRITHGRIF